MGRTTISITDETKTRFIKVKGALEHKNGKSRSEDDVMNELIGLFNHKEKERLAWEEIKKIYDSIKPLPCIGTDLKNALGLEGLKIPNEEQRKQIKDILKKYDLDENHILLEHARQVYEAW
jgi:hypothetical protein